MCRVRAGCVIRRCESDPKRSWKRLHQLLGVFRQCPVMPAVWPAGLAQIFIKGPTRLLCQLEANGRPVFPCRTVARPRHQCGCRCVSCRSRLASLCGQSGRTPSMERFIADLVKDYESGKVDRREFCKTVALAATVSAAGDTAMAQAPRALKVVGINHGSYTCPDYAKVPGWDV